MIKMTKEKFISLNREVEEEVFISTLNLLKNNNISPVVINMVQFLRDENFLLEDYYCEIYNREQKDKFSYLKEIIWSDKQINSYKSTKRYKFKRKIIKNLKNFFDESVMQKVRDVLS